MTTYGKGTKGDGTRTKFALWKLVVDRPRHSADGTFDATKTIVARVPTCELFAFLLTKTDDYDCCLNMVFYAEDEGSGGDEDDLADAKQRYDVPEVAGNGGGGETFDLIIDEGKNDRRSIIEYNPICLWL